MLTTFFIGRFRLQQNIFGGDLGGPVGPKAKFGYFYVNYQGTRQRSGDSLGTYISNAGFAGIAHGSQLPESGQRFLSQRRPAYANAGNGDCGLDP